MTDNLVYCYILASKMIQLYFSANEDIAICMNTAERFFTIENTTLTHAELIPTKYLK